MEQHLHAMVGEIRIGILILWAFSAVSGQDGVSLLRQIILSSNNIQGDCKTDATCGDKDPCCSR